ncbi:MAG: GAF domain-containing protein [Anaerolineae bacterium]|nr:GAF domain-containing protein [Anaerolineae bacterium]
MSDNCTQVNILVVEDDGIIAAYLCRMLERQGYTVVGPVRSGEEALEKVEAVLPDVVLMDIDLAGEMNGLQATAQIRKQFDIPVIYLTAYFEDALLQEAKASDPFGYVVKPINDRDLQAAIEVALYRHQLEQKLKASERWLDTTLRSIGDAVIATDVAGNVILMNARAEALSGWQQETARGRSLVDVVHLTCEADETCMKSAFARAVEEGVTVNLPCCELQQSEGVRVLLEGNLSPIRDKSGRVDGLVLVFRDTTDYRRAQQALQERTAQLEMLREVGLEVTGQLDLNAVLKSIARRAADLLDGTGGGVYLYRQDRDVLEWAVSVHPNPPFLGSTLAKGEGLGGRVWETGRALCVEDYQNWEGRAAVLEGADLFSVVGAPVCWGDEFLGVLNVDGGAGRTFSQADADLLALFAAQAAVAIRNARLYEQAHQRNVEQQTVSRIAYALNTLHVQDAFPVLEKSLRELTACDRVSLVFLDSERGEFVISDVLTPRRALQKGARMSLEMAASANGLLAGRPHWTDDLETERDFLAERLLLEAGFRSRVNLPLILGGEGIGALNLASVHPHHFRRDQLPVFEQIADLLTSAIENSRLFEEEHRRRREADTLRETALVLTTALDEREVVARILTQLQKVVPYDSSSLQLLRFSTKAGEPDRLEIVGGSGFPDLDGVLGLTFPVGGDNPNTEVVRTRAPVVVADAPHVYRDFLSGPHHDSNIISWMGVPVLIGDRMIGMLTLDKREPAFYTEEHARLAEAFAAHAAVAIENARLHRQLIDYTDHLESLVDQKVRELDMARAKLIHAGKMTALGELATGIAHELNQPLTAILNEANYLKKVAEKIERDPGDASSYNFYAIGEDLAQDVYRCRRIVDHVRAFGHPPEQRVSTVDLNHSIEEGFIILEAQLRRQSVIVQRDLAPALPLIFADPQKLEQVFINLVSNATHAMEEMARRVESGEAERPNYRKRLDVSTRVEEGAVVAVVQDNGCGIPQAVRDRIFEPFFTTKPVGVGTGLGLSISADIVEEFGGQISFESEENAGTTFTLRFPIVFRAA